MHFYESFNEYHNYCAPGSVVSLVPRPPRPALIACSTKRPGRTYHVMRAAADVTYYTVASHDRSSINRTRRTN